VPFGGAERPNCAPAPDDGLRQGQKPDWWRQRLRAGGRPKHSSVLRWAFGRDMEWCEHCGTLNEGCARAETPSDVCSQKAGILPREANLPCKEVRASLHKQASWEAFWAWRRVPTHFERGWRIRFSLVVGRLAMLLKVVAFRCIKASAEKMSKLAERFCRALTPEHSFRTQKRLSPSTP
jgi:hypothetical protein